MSNILACFSLVNAELRVCEKNSTFIFGINTACSIPSHMWHKLQRVSSYDFLIMPRRTGKLKYGRAVLIAFFSHTALDKYALILNINYININYILICDNHNRGVS